MFFLQLGRLATLMFKSNEFLHVDAIKMIIHFFPQRVGLSKNATVVLKKSSAGFIPWRTAARVGKNRYLRGEVFSFFPSCTTGTLTILNAHNLILAHRTTQVLFFAFFR